MPQLKVNSEKIRKLMKEQGLSVRKMAEEMGIDHTYLSRVLNGKQKPGRKFVEGLLTLYKDQDFNDFFFLE